VSLETCAMFKALRMNTLNDVTTSNETPRTPFSQLMVQTFPIYGQENLCSIPKMLCEEYTGNEAKPF
jgi:hypothetical protein